jgi:hypothetical protein
MIGSGFSEAHSATKQNMNWNDVGTPVMRLPKSRRYKDGLKQMVTMVMIHREEKGLGAI